MLLLYPRKNAPLERERREQKVALDIDSRDSTQVILRHIVGNPGAEELQRYLSPTRHPIPRFQAESKSNDIAWSGIGRNYELVCESVC